MQTVKKRTLYQGAYRKDLEEPVTPAEETTTQDVDASTTSDADLSAEELSWKKRYGDLRSFSDQRNTQQTERIKSLEAQLQAAQKQEVRIPSTKEELDSFAKKYPDVFRHIRSIAMTELLQERENLQTETKAVKDNLEQVQRELGYKKILLAHPDFEEINGSEEFQAWADKQPQQIQDWLFSSTDPDLCIKGLDLYKHEMEFLKRAKARTKPANGADTLVKTRSPAEVPDQMGNKKIWKASEIQKLHPKMYEKFEDEIELARLEGRIDLNA